MSDWKHHFRLSPSPTLSEVDEVFWTMYDHTSDLFIQSDDFIKARIHGRIIPISLVPLPHDSILHMYEEMASSSSLSGILKGEPDSRIHRITKDNVTIRFRQNARLCETLYERRGLQFVCRPIPKMPPLLADLNLPKDLCDSLRPTEGFVLISGPTGSGKTTLLGAVSRDLVTDSDGLAVETIEDPVEFNLFSVPGRTGFLSHSELHTHFVDFNEAMRALLRENPDVILCGELRDAKTIRMAAEAAETGHTVYGTIHTNSAATTPLRAAMKVDPIDRQSFIDTMLGSSRVFIHQRLENTTDGKRAPIMEYIVFSAADRVKMQSVFKNNGVGAACALINSWIHERGGSLVQSARKLADAGLITENRFLTIARDHEVQTNAEIETDIG